MIVVYTFVPYDKLPKHIGERASFLYRVPAGHLTVQKGYLTLEGFIDKESKRGSVLILRSEDDFVTGIVIQPTDRVYVKT